MSVKPKISPKQASSSGEPPAAPSLPLRGPWLSEKEAIARLQAVTSELSQLGVRRLKFIGFEAPWEWRLEPALRLAVAYDRNDWDSRCEITFFLEDYLEREIHFTRLLSERPEPEGVEIDGLG